MSDDTPSADVSRRKFLASSTGATALALGLAGCSENDGSDGNESDDSGGGGDGSLSGTIDIAGSSTVFPLATSFAERFTNDNSDVEINVQSTGSGGGFANLFCPGRTDVNNASRRVKPEEEEACAENDIEMVELEVATDALTVVVNNDNGFADSMTTEQLATLWSAESQPETWADINDEWPSETIELYGPSDASGTYDYFIDAILQGGDRDLSHRQDYSGTEQDRTIMQGVQDSEFAVGYLGFAYYTENSDQVTAVAVDDGDGPVEPSLDTAKSGEYTPLARPLFTYPKRASLGEDHVAEFARYWIENSSSREIVADEVGYVPLTDDQVNTQLEALNAAVEEEN
jgi:phosphate transport system substrate-binding protein